MVKAKLNFLYHIEEDMDSLAIADAARVMGGKSTEYFSERKAGSFYVHAIPYLFDLLRLVVTVSVT